MYSALACWQNGPSLLASARAALEGQLEGSEATLLATVRGLRQKSTVYDHPEVVDGTWGIQGIYHNYLKDHILSTPGWLYVPLFRAPFLGTCSHNTFDSLNAPC